MFHRGRGSLRVLLGCQELSGSGQWKEVCFGVRKFLDLDAGSATAGCDTMGTMVPLEAQFLLLQIRDHFWVTLMLP